MCRCTEDSDYHFAECEPHDAEHAEMEQERLERFGSTYVVELERAVREHPEEYVWPVEQVPVVAAKMMNAIQRRTFNKDSHAIKATCKVFGIKHTYQGIYAWLEGES